MATLTCGPVVSDPATTGFKVWCAASGTGTAKLYVAAHGSTLALVDTQSIDGTKYNTAVLTATGLNAGTSYDYRVDVDGHAGTVYTTVTMPQAGSGSFLIYGIVCTHEGVGYVAQAASTIIHDVDTNYPGTPAIIIIHGDFIDTTGDADFRTGRYVNEINQGVSAFARFPVLYMWDDHDFGGNNANRTDQDATVPPNDITNPQACWDRIWRALPRPASPSYGYTYEIAGIPIIVADARSQKARTDAIVGDEPYQDSVQLFGTTQQAYLRTQLTNYANRALVFFVHSHTFADAIIGTTGTGSHSAGGQRDSTGIYHHAARNDLFATAVGLGYGNKRNLVVLTGDDHRNTVFLHRGLMRPVGKNATVNRPAVDLDLNFAEVKTQSGPSASVGQSDTIFGLGNYFDSIAADVPMVTAWYVTGTNGGQHATARLRFLYTKGALVNQTATSSAGVSAGKAGDLMFKDGVWAYYSTDSALVSQSYPPDSVAPQTWEGAYIDDINGVLVREGDAVRDEHRLLRDRHDIGERDRDDMLKDWVQPIEPPIRDP